MVTTTYVDGTFGVREIGARTDSAGTAVDDLPLEQDALINAILTEGYLTAGAFQVAADSPASMDVIVGSGTAKADIFVVATDETGRHPYLVRLDDASLTVTVDAADASNPRIDEIWLVVRDPALSGDGGTLALPRIAYRKGDAGADPSAPGADSAWAASVKLATITVGAGVSSIGSGDIADNRVAAELNPTLSGQFADVDGDTFTGAVTFEALGTFEAGVQGSLGDDVHAVTASQSAWPTGLSWQRVTSGSWPSTTGAVYTFNYGNDVRTWQLFIDSAPTSDARMHFRRWTASNWSSWSEVTTAEDPGRWEVEGSTEVSGATTTTTSFANFASVSLTIPSDWSSWRCEAYATFRWQGDTAGTFDTRIVIDGTAQQTLGPLEPQATNKYAPGVVGGRRTGMSTTGSRTVSVQMKHTSQQMTVDSIYLHARAVRTS